MRMRCMQKKHGYNYRIPLWERHTSQQSHLKIRLRRQSHPHHMAILFWDYHHEKRNLCEKDFLILKVRRDAVNLANGVSI